MASQPLLLRGGRVLRTGGARPERIDVAIGADGRIERLGPNLQASAGAKVFDLGDKLVSPGLVDCHQHLDKTRTLRDVPNPAGTLLGAVAAFNDYAARITPESLRKRADRTVSACLARGTVAIRTHANVDPVLRGRAVDMLVDLRERWRDRMRIQVVAFVTAGATRLGDTAKEWLDSAIAAGADVIGGTPAISDQPEAFMDMLFDAAERHGMPVDLHLDEHLDAGRQLFDAVIARTKARGMAGRVAVGHCSALSAMAPDDAKRVIAGFAEAGIAVITLPAANLFLQGREAPALPPRGLTRVREPIEAGGCAPAPPGHNPEPFVAARTQDTPGSARVALPAGALWPAELDRAYAMVTQAPAATMGFGREYGIHEGARADLTVSDADDVEDLVASGPPVQAVLLEGRLTFGSM